MIQSKRPLWSNTIQSELVYDMRMTHELYRFSLEKMQHIVNFNIRVSIDVVPVIKCKNQD